MQRLHLVGFTTDLDGLIFSARKGAKSGGFLVPLDGQLLGSIAEAERIRNGESSGAGGKSAGGGEQRRDRPTNSLLTPRQIQARLRAGQSIEEVAAEAKVDTEWVERFAVPVVAEQTRMVSQARSSTYSKARLGQSTQDLATSVRWNLADKGVILAADVFDEGWSAFQMQDDIWMVRFGYNSRGREQLAEWEFDAGARHLTSRNRLASELGYVEKGRRRRPMVPPPAPPAAPPPAPVVRPIIEVVVVEEPEPEPKARPRRPPAKKAATRAAPRKTAKKATTKKATRKLAARKTTARRTSAGRTAVRKTTARKTTARKAPARKAGARKAGARKAGARKASAGTTSAKKATVRKTTARKTTARKTTTRKATARRAAPKKAARTAPARTAPTRTPSAGTATTSMAAPKEAAVRRPLAVSRAGTRPQLKKRLPKTPPQSAAAPARSREPGPGPLTRSLLARRLAARSSGTPRVVGERAGGPVGKRNRPLRPSR